MLVLVGYLAALAATPTGHGLGLLAHLASAHGTAPPAAPALVVGVPTAERPVLSTLRRLHRHGAGPAHGHGEAAPRRHTVPVLVLATPPAQGSARAGWPGADVHEHDGEVHTHTAPTRQPAVAAGPSLDKHRRAEAPAVPGPPAPTVAAVGRGGAGPPQTSLPVETPPPRGRG